MILEFEVGREEKHKVQFVLNRFWGTVSIKVNGKIVQKGRLEFYFILLGWVPVLLVLIGWMFFNFGEPSYRNSIGSYLNILFWVLFISVYVLQYYLFKKRSYRITIGEDEKTLVDIQKLRTGWLSRSTDYTISVDGERYKIYRSTSRFPTPKEVKLSK